MKSREHFSCRAPPLFLSLKVQLVVLVSVFVMGSTVWSVSCLLFFYSRCPPCPAICKSEGHVPPCPMESVPLVLLNTSFLERPSLYAAKRLCIQGHYGRYIYVAVSSFMRNRLLRVKWVHTSFQNQTLWQTF